MYEEAFYKTVYWGARSKGLQRLKGTLPQLLNAICQEWGYHVKKAGDDYVLWSKTWAQDRARDIPESLLAQWRKRGERQAGYTLDDRIEMASSLTWPQLRLTLPMAIEKAGPWETKRDADILRFIGRLSPAERRMLENNGLAFTAMDDWHQQTLLGELLSRTGSLRVEQAKRSYLILTYDKNRASINDTVLAKRCFLEVKSESGSSLWQCALLSTADTIRKQK